MLNNLPLRVPSLLVFPSQQSELHAKIDSGAAASVLYPAIAPASIVLDHSPRDASDAVLRQIFPQLRFPQSLGNYSHPHSVMISINKGKSPVMPSREKIITREI